MPDEFSSVITGIPDNTPQVTAASAVAADDDFFGFTVPSEVGDGTAEDLDLKFRLLFGGVRRPNAELAGFVGAVGRGRRGAESGT